MTVAYHRVENGQATSPDDLNQLLNLHSCEVGYLPAAWSAVCAVEDSYGGWYVPSTQVLGSTPVSIAGPAAGSGGLTIGALAVPLQPAGTRAADVTVSIVDTTASTTLFSCVIPGEVIQAGLSSARFSALLASSPAVTPNTQLPSALANTNTMNYALGPNGWVVLAGGESVTSAYESGVYLAQLQAGPTLGPWQTGTALPQAIVGPAQCQSSLIYDSGYLVLFGGYVSGGYTTNCWVASLSPSGQMGAWQSGPSVPLPGGQQIPLMAASDGNGHIWLAPTADTYYEPSTLYTATLTNGVVSGYGVIPIPGELPSPAAMYVVQGRLVVLFLIGSQTSTYAMSAPIAADGSLGPWSPVVPFLNNPFSSTDGSNIVSFYWGGQAPALFTTTSDPAGNLGQIVQTGPAASSGGFPPNIDALFSYALNEDTTLTYTFFGGMGTIAPGQGVYQLTRWQIIPVPAINVAVPANHAWEVQISVQGATDGALSETTEPGVFFWESGPVTPPPFPSMVLSMDSLAAWDVIDSHALNGSVLSVVEDVGGLASAVQCSYGASTGRLLAIGPPASTPLLVSGA